MLCRTCLRAQKRLGASAARAQRRAASSPGGSSDGTQTTPRDTVIFSGIQPTGVPHLGNYLGALRQWVRLQDEPEAVVPGGVGAKRLLYSIVDLHAITMPQQADKLRQWRREALAALLAIGLDPERSIIFYQSSVPAHSELMWILSCTASMGYLSRMTQWKSKLHLAEDASLQDEKARSALKLGLFSYPVLQAADILVHRATHVPVGEDQRQHLEFARECATNFNHAFGPHLVAPETILSPARRIMSLQQPNQKMSKSATDPRSRILLTDTPAEIRKKIMGALTDSTNAVSYDPVNRPGVSNLLELLSIFGEGNGGKSAAELAEEMGSSNLGQLKARVADAVLEGIGGVRERFLDFLERDDGKYLDRVEAEGARKANASAQETMELVRAAVGL
ncbi:Tryptophanyl-tRNA synthetase [Pleurostoma richardsiae]|uniref:Tryptophan--tRNA ligase, mitochondrial n=1 Tax=Pleurostoma richardsiae TaxID=41990 RepID=A0AA38RNC2_9PEZI|nr:Tryptophanyl-tRNA synthetase [Pleurostoma richardsiae]